jgi:hypothetical protein
MKNPILAAILTLILSSLACMEQVAPPSVSGMFTAVAATPSLVPATPTRRAVPSATAEDVQTTTIQATVYVRQEPDPNSAAIGSLTTGERVEIVSCSGDWCELDRGGYVWRGCTDDNPDELLCEARP